MSDKLPSPKDIKDTCEHLERDPEFYGYDADNTIKILNAYASGLLQSTQTYSEQDVHDLFWSKATMVTKIGGDEWSIKKKDWNEIAHALAGKLAKPVGDREKLAKTIWHARASFPWDLVKESHILKSECYRIADIIIKEVNGGK
jgi:hypothetical protein